MKVPPPGLGASGGLGVEPAVVAIEEVDEPIPGLQSAQTFRGSGRAGSARPPLAPSPVSFVVAGVSPTSALAHALAREIVRTCIGVCLGHPVGSATGGKDRLPTLGRRQDRGGGARNELEEAGTALRGHKEARRQLHVDVRTGTPRMPGSEASRARQDDDWRASGRTTLSPLATQRDT